MKTLLNDLKKAKYISLLILVCMTFTFAADFRYYINQSVYAAFNLGNLGAFGTKLYVSVLVAVFAAIGWGAGMLTAFLTRKKKVNAVTLYWLSGMFAVVMLFFTPYNLQLLMSATIMQNIVMIDCIAHIVFILVDMWLFAWALCAGSRDVLMRKEKYGIAIISVVAAVATALAFASIACKWSFVIQTAVYGSILTALNVFHAAFPEREEGEEIKEISCAGSSGRKELIVAAAVTILFIAVLVGAYFITEQYIAIA